MKISSKTQKYRALLYPSPKHLRQNLQALVVSFQSFLSDMAELCWILLVR